MLHMIYLELLEIKKELQAIRSNLESLKTIRIDGEKFSQSVQKATHDSIQEVVKMRQKSSH